MHLGVGTDGNTEILKILKFRRELEQHEQFGTLFFPKVYRILYTVLKHSLNREGRLLVLNSSYAIIKTRQSPIKHTTHHRCYTNPFIE